MVGQFVAVVALLTLWVLLERFLGARSSLAFVVLGMPLLAFATLTVIVWAAWGIRWQKVVVLVLAVVVDMGFISGKSTLSRVGDRLFFETRRSRLETFSRDVVLYGRIRQMSAGTRHFTELNGQLVASSAAAVTPGAASKTRPLAEVLARDAIEVKRYEEFRDRLRALKLTQLEAEPEFVAFLYDGMLDNLEGYLVVKPGATPPAIRSTLFGATLISLEPLGDGWYRFATT